jgi:thiamine pyrophosphate-dependent acetolactate synthase large subunit-like protein
VSEQSTAGRILGALEAAGIEVAFGLPGVHNLSFWSALDAGGELAILGVRHEQAAVYAADGLARATGGLGVAIVTSGPGAANTLAAFGEAASCGVPVLVIASDVPEGLRDRDHPRGLLHESPDPGAWFAPMAKAVFQPTSSEEAVANVVTAIETAMAHPRGPVYVGVPADVLADDAPAAPEISIPAAAPADPAEIHDLANLVATSQRPLLWVGGGAVSSDAATAVDALAWRLGSPVLSTYAGRGVLPVGHPLLVDLPPHEPVARAVMT